MNLRDYQRDAVEQVQRAWSDGHTAATVVLPCGTGKTAVAVAATAGVSQVVVLVPTNALLEQTAAVWERSCPQMAQLWVTSARPDPASGDDLPAPPEATTDVDVIADRLGQPRPVVVCATYASAGKVAAGCAQAGVTVGVVIADEAHRTAGEAGQQWHQSTQQIPTRRRLFLTATPREVTADERNRDPITGELVPVVSMDDPAIYGPRFTSLSLRQAIANRWLSDYRIAVVAVTPDDLPAPTAGGEVVTDTGQIITDIDAAAAQVALLRYAATHPDVNSVLAFHNRVADSAAWVDQLDSVVHVLSPADRPAGTVNATHIDGTMTGTVRAEALERLAHVPSGSLHVVSNCRVLSEGVDVPALDAVLFAQPRTSAPDIIQIVGRALRLHPTSRRRKATIIIPVFVDTGDRSTVETVIARTNFYRAWQVLTALAYEDHALYATLARLAANLPPTTPQPGEEDAVEVEIDTSALPAGWADQFGLRLLNRTVNPWEVLAVHYRDHINAGGSPVPGTEFTRHDYPLGRRLSEIRSLYRAGKLPDPVVARFEELPAWTWTPRTARRRSFDQWVELCAAHVAHTGMSTIAPYEKRTLSDGTVATVGAWLHKQRHARLTREQRDQLTAAVPGWNRS